MKSFFRYLIVTGMQRYGSFMWFGTHVSMTQTDWHWILETGLCILVNALVMIGLYFEWKDREKI